MDEADFSGARLHSPNFESTRITDAWLLNADISGFVEGLRVNGVEEWEHSRYANRDLDVLTSRRG
ncbi:MAG: hypothetical protein ACYDEN_01310 [Acidimicrobiales bacterium]